LRLKGSEEHACLKHPTLRHPPGHYEATTHPDHVGVNVMETLLLYVGEQQRPHARAFAEEVRVECKRPVRHVFHARGVIWQTKTIS
jgi:hypothetical protein